jgi:hypothetical protein
MTRMFTLMAALLLGTLAFAAPIPKAIKTSKVPQLAGTTWVSEDQADLGCVNYTFHEDGKLTYSYGKNGTSTYNDASWKQDGATVYFECNKKYVEYNGTIEDGVMMMHAANVAKREWDVRIHPKNDK